MTETTLDRLTEATRYFESMERMARTAKNTTFGKLEDLAVKNTAPDWSLLNEVYKTSAVAEQYDKIHLVAANVAERSSIPMNQALIIACGTVRETLVNERLAGWDECRSTDDASRFIASVKRDAMTRLMDTLADIVRHAEGV
jgi:hypothetical protein